jgi:DNA (cytosine-5)-methyltransferase 1
VIAYDPNQITSRANRSNPAPRSLVHTLPASSQPPIIVHAPEASQCLTTGTGRRYDAETETLLAFHPTQDPISGEVSHALGANATVAVSGGFGVRRLTPTECERLQGFPDGHTAITVRGKPAADGPRYKAIGNSMAVPVMAWIGRRIQEQA